MIEKKIDFLTEQLNQQRDCDESSRRWQPGAVAACSVIGQVRVLPMRDRRHKNFRQPSDGPYVD
jgi:hypothetical protein